MGYRERLEESMLEEAVRLAKEHEAGIVFQSTEHPLLFYVVEEDEDFIYESREGFIRVWDHKEGYHEKRA